MPYKIILERDEQIIFEKSIGADQAIDMIIANPHAVINDNVVEEPKKQKSVKTGGGSGSGVRHCKKCGKVGHRSDNCTDNEEEVPRQNDTLDGGVSRAMFMMIRKAKHDGRDIETIAEAHNMNEEEIGLIYKCTSYESYLELRK